jgi:uncharacterized protein
MPYYWNTILSGGGLSWKIFFDSARLSLPFSTGLTGDTSFRSTTWIGLWESSWAKGVPAKQRSWSVPFSPDLSKLTELTDVADQRTLKTYLKYLEDSGLILGLSRTGRGLRALEKPEKIYLNNPNLIYAFSTHAEMGNIRDTFFLNMLRTRHTLKAPDRGDFLVDDKYLFEIGGKNKNFSQIRDTESSFLALDDLEKGFGKKIPLWMFGFLY